MSDILLKWALGFNGIIILSLIGVVWGMRVGELKRIEGGLQKEINRLDVEVKDLRVRKHDNIEAMSQLAGRVHMIEDDLDMVKRNSYLANQLLQHAQKDG